MYPLMLFLGYCGETGARTVRVHVGGMVHAWPGAVCSLFLCRPGEEAPYPAETELDGEFLVARIRACDTAIPGYGTAQVVLLDGTDVVAKSAVYRTEIRESLNGTAGDTPPPSAPEWITGVFRAEEMADRAQAAAEMWENVSASAESVPAADEAEAEFTRDPAHFHFKIPRAMGFVPHLAGNRITWSAWNGETSIPDMELGVGGAADSLTAGDCTLQLLPSGVLRLTGPGNTERNLTGSGSVHSERRTLVLTKAAWDEGWVIPDAFVNTDTLLLPLGGVPGPNLTWETGDGEIRILGACVEAEVSVLLIKEET